MQPVPDEADGPTDHGIAPGGATTSTPAEAPRWESTSPQPASLGGIPPIPNWATATMHYWYITIPLTILVCSGVCGGLFAGVWWLAERLINAWIVS